MSRLLDVIIPGRNEEWMSRTINDVLDNSRGDTGVIAILDGYWPEPKIKDRKNLMVIHHTKSVGQRAAINEGARISRAKYIMKLDAHCCVSEGFDVIMTNDMQYDWMMVPRMFNFHVFDWQCKKCGYRKYMGPALEKCPKCEANDFEKAVVWKPRLKRRSDFMRFNHDMRFKYWKQFERRPESKGDVADQMCCIGACWMYDRNRFWDLEGCDEQHGSWGQQGVEHSCKNWLSGGRQVVHKGAYFAHMFRTQKGFGFPYPNPGAGKAREYSRWLWYEGKNWHKSIYPLSWLLEKFWPVPEWTEEMLEDLKKRGN